MEHDIIICFNKDALYHDGDNYAHTALIEKYENDKVYLIEVDKTCDIRVVKIEDLIMSMMKLGKENRAGFWLIK